MTDKVYLLYFGIEAKGDKIGSFDVAGVFKSMENALQGMKQQQNDLNFSGEWKQVKDNLWMLDDFYFFAIKEREVM